MLGHVATSVGNALPGSGGKVALLPAAITRYFNTGARTWTAPADGIVEIAAIAAGSGARGSSSTPSGGGGGAAGRFYPFEVKAGQTIGINIGAPSPAVTSGSSLAASPTTITLPDGRVGAANGGQSASTAVGATGGTASGFDLNSAGGSGITGSASASSGSGENNGGPGYVGSTGNAAGGGGGGVEDFLQSPRVNDRFSYSADDIGRAGNGGVGSSSGTAGAPGWVFILFQGYKL